jgi:hypothetical protein
MPRQVEMRLTELPALAVAEQDVAAKHYRGFPGLSSRGSEILEELKT